MEKSEKRAVIKYFYLKGLTPFQIKEELDSTNERLFAIIFNNETWIHHYTPESKQQSKQWIGPGEPTPKKAKTILSANKVMATAFWDAKGIIFIDYLEKDLAPSDYHLFPNLKKWLGGKKIKSNREVIDAVNEYFEGLDESHYKNGITALEHRYEKCINFNGDYVEK
ncbi:unnamed protein product [Euphydryas editha]|uniref:Uncharacterized protein n=1 Tax=Euphydryas editha TaxID=104508 RepID=A0AAU9UNJ6_EUPED|nr:unnamed protein product [Euphydryas editha]